jgi:hypothetical protein
MYGIFTYIWVIFRATVGKYSSTMEHMGYKWCHPRAFTIYTLAWGQAERSNARSPEGNVSRVPGWLSFIKHGDST